MRSCIIPRPVKISEYVELFNQMGVDMDVSGWRLSDAIEFTFPAKTVIPSGEYMVVARSPEALLAAAGVNSLGPFNGRLSNGGETIELRDRNDRTLDVIDYSDGGDWPIAPDGLGASLAKTNPNLTSSQAAHWTSSIVVGGTPGAVNFGEAVAPQDEIHQALISLDHRWRVDDQGNDLGNGWRDPEFDDSQWSSGAPAPYYAGAGRFWQGPKLLCCQT